MYSKEVSTHSYSLLCTPLRPEKPRHCSGRGNTGWIKMVTICTGSVYLPGKLSVGKIRSSHSSVKSLSHWVNIAKIKFGLFRILTHFFETFLWCFFCFFKKCLGYFWIYFCYFRGMSEVFWGYFLWFFSGVFFLWLFFVVFLGYVWNIYKVFFVRFCGIFLGYVWDIMGNFWEVSEYFWGYFQCIFVMYNRVFRTIVLIFFWYFLCYFV